MTLGVNVDPRYDGGRPDAGELRRHGIAWVRMISLPENEQYAADCLANGVRVLAVYTGESDAAGRYVMYRTSCLQVGNEPQFAMDGAASWPTGTTDDYVNVWNHVANVLVQGRVPLVGPGIWAHDYSKWAQVANQLPGLSAAAVHVYPGASNESIVQTKFFLAKYRGVRSDLPLICTEWTERQPKVLATARAIEAYCDHWMWYAWGPGVPGHTLVGTPELGILALA